jgi:hypothetical protein
LEPFEDDDPEPTDVDPVVVGSVHEPWALRRGTLGRELSALDAEDEVLEV